MYLLPLCFHCFCVLCILQVCRSCQFLVRLGWWLWPLLLVGSRDWGRWSTGRAGGLDGSNTGLWRPLDYRNCVNSWWSFDGSVFQSGGRPFCFGLWQMFAWFIVVFFDILCIFCAYLRIDLRQFKQFMCHSCMQCFFGRLAVCPVVTAMLPRITRSNTQMRCKPPSRCFLFELFGRSTDIWHQKEVTHLQPRVVFYSSGSCKYILNLCICSHFLLMTLLLLCYLQWTNWLPTWHTLLGTETLRFHESCLKL